MGYWSLTTCQSPGNEDPNMMVDGAPGKGYCETVKLLPGGEWGCYNRSKCTSGSNVSGV